MRHFTSSIELKSTIEDGQYKTDPELCQKLVSFVKTKMFEVVGRNGCYTGF